MGEEGAWLWLQAWQLTKSQENHWKRLPKGTKVRLVSTNGLESLYKAFQSGSRPVSFLIDNLDITTEAGQLRSYMHLNEHYTVVPEAAFSHVLSTYISQAVEGYVVWEGVLQPSLFLAGSSLHVLECFEDKSTLIEVSLEGLNCTTEDTVERVERTWGNRDGSLPPKPTWWTCANQPSFSSYDGRKVTFCPLNRRLIQIKPDNKSLWKVLNSTCLIAEHRLPLADLRPQEKLGVGLENLGKTCFMNAILQCLLHIPLFLQYILHNYTPIRDHSLVSLLHDLITSTYWDEKTSTVKPLEVFQKLCEVHNYDKRTREDANEVFLVILDILHSEQRVERRPQLLETGREEVDAWVACMQQEPSLKSELFSGLQQQRLLCTICQQQQSHTLPFCSLSLDLPSPRSFSITIVPFDPTRPQVIRTFNSNIPLEDNAIIHNVRELVISETGNPNVILGENRNMLLEARIGLSNMVTSNSFIALELPTLEADLRLILVDFYTRSEPLCTRVISVHKGVGIGEVISDVIYYLVQVEAAKEMKLVGWLSRSSSESTFRQYRRDSEFLFLSQNDQLEPIPNLQSQGLDTIGDLCLNLGDKLPRFRFTSGTFSSNAKAHLRTINPISSRIWSLFSPKQDSNLTVTLHQLLDFTLCDKPLNEEDLLMCSHCQRPTQHVVSTRIMRFPRILTLVFQRVRVMPTQLSKSFIQIQYPVEGLDLGEREIGANEDPPMYDLQAVVQHKGGSLTKGHYVALAEDPASMRWVTYNDTSVEPGEALVDGAYMLFYVRRLG